MANKRPDGDGLVRKRKDGRWEGRIVVGHKANGTPIFRSVFAKTQKMLMEKLHQHIETYRDVELSEDCDIPLGVAGSMERELCGVCGTAQYSIQL